jgi:hypothetical protein
MIDFADVRKANKSSIYCFILVYKQSLETLISGLIIDNEGNTF